MIETDLTATVRQVDNRISIIDVRGEITATAEDALVAAYAQAADKGSSIILLNLHDLKRIDGGGLFLLVRLLARVRRQQRRLMAFGLSEHHQQVFELTRLHETLAIFSNESEALNAAGAPVKDALAPPRPGVPGDGGEWAAPISTLAPPATPPEAINLNVRRRRLFGPLQGFGQMWLKTYRVRLAAADITSPEVIRTWKTNFPAFWPGKNRFYGSPNGIAPGETAVLNLSGPGGLPIATGIFVMHADEHSFTFSSPEGHILGGWINFSAYEEGGAVIAQVQALFRGGDPLYELGFLTGIAHKAEDTFWGQTLSALAAHFGAEAEVEQHSELLDPRLQWSRLTNIWYNAAVRTTLYAPFHWMGRLLRG